MSTKKLWLTVGIITTCALSPLTMAKSVQRTVTAKLVLTGTCTVDASAINLDFGTYPAGIGDQLGLNAGNLSVTCPPGVSYRWGANGGGNWKGTSADKRHLTNSGSKFIPYDIQLVSTNLNIGDKSLNTIDPSYVPTTTSCSSCESVSDTGTGAAITYPLKANVYVGTGAGAVYPSGTYTDSVIFTVVWP